MKKPTDYISSVKPSWCPGCSNFGIRAALLNALAELELEPSQIAMIYDIGCLGNSANWFKTYGFHGLHGRTVPVAIGAKLANRDLTVIGLAGDGAIYGEGLNHLVEACRSNIDITLIVSNNGLYSLTTGQASPTTLKGVKTKSTPEGTIKEGLNPLALALEAGASFVARGYTNDPKNLTETIKKAILHRGFALVDVIQPCLTIGKDNLKQPQKKIFSQKKKLTYLDNLPYLKSPLIKQKKVNPEQFLKEFK